MLKIDQHKNFFPKIIPIRRFSKLFLFVVSQNYLLINFYFKGGHHQKRLLEKLFKKYNKIERPVYNDSHSLNVSVGLGKWIVR